MSDNFSLVIVGGGTAGWMAANLLAHRWGGRDISITLVESDSIATVGVGEGSTPFLKNFFRTLDIPESEWMPACSATYKCGIRFPNWSEIPGYTSYFHPFFSPLDQEVGMEFFDRADQRRRGGGDDAVPDHFFHAPYLATAAKAPIPLRPLPFELDYAYHFDAGLLGGFLKGKALARGVTHRVATIAEVETSNRGIAGLVTSEGSRITADFFVDCTGFRAQLLSALPDYRYRDYSKTLFNNAAVTLQVERAPEQPLVSETVSEALSSGWMWRIPLQHRTGLGYVYSTNFLSAEEAERELRARAGVGDDAYYRHLKMRVGRVEQHWLGNCLGLGLSQGFIEPLEATALMLVQFTLEKFVASFSPEAGAAAEQPMKFNEQMNAMFDGVLNYVAGHYLLNTRSDTEYWRAVREDMEVPSALEELIRCWDSSEDFTALLPELDVAGVYSRASWYCLLAGMGRFPQPRRAATVSGRRLLEEVRRFCSGNVSRFYSHEQQLSLLTG